MFINAIGHYLPSNLLTNDYFTKLAGLTDEWITSRTGMKSRTKAGENENTNTMAIDATQNAIKKLPYGINDVDLVVGGTYSPYDTVATLAHVIQESFKIENAKVISISSACSSFINALEIAQGYFAMNKATKALVVVSEHNSAYNNEHDQYSGHLWGDGAATVFVSKERITDNDVEIVDIETLGLAHIGKGTQGVGLRPNDKIAMRYGKDIFIHACNYMAQLPLQLLSRNEYTLDNLRYLVPHQANLRIIANIKENLNLPDEKLVVNADRYGNTGCASSAIGLSEVYDTLQKGDLAIVTVFGGGYSAGAALLRY